MKLHANAALSLNRRRLLCRRVTEEGLSLTEAAEAAEVSGPTARKWVARYLAEGDAGLLDRPSAAHCVHNRTPEERIEAIGALRRLRFTGAEIAEILAMPQTTVSGILTRVGLGRLGRLGLEPARRYERSRPGELVHVDSRLARGGAVARVALALFVWRDPVGRQRLTSAARFPSREGRSASDPSPELARFRGSSSSAWPAHSRRDRW